MQYIYKNGKILIKRAFNIFDIAGKIKHGSSQKPKPSLQRKTTVVVTKKLFRRGVSSSWNKFQRIMFWKEFKSLKICSTTGQQVDKLTSLHFTIVKLKLWLICLIWFALYEFGFCIKISCVKFNYQNLILLIYIILITLYYAFYYAMPLFNLKWTPSFSMFSHGIYWQEFQWKISTFASHWFPCILHDNFMIVKLN